MRVISLQIHARAGDIMDKEILLMHELSLTFNKQPEFTALGGAIHDFTNLKQEFE